MSSPRVDDDRDRIVHVSKTWWEANVGLDIAALRRCFPGGKDFLMFNLNSFAYFGVDEVERLWTYLKERFPFRTTQTVRVMQMKVSGDMAWLATETTCVKGGVNTASRSTEIYHRDDGEGHPEWRMWHFHSSALQFDFSKRPEFTMDVPRIAFGDTIADRGIGAIPGSAPILEYVTKLADVQR